MLEKYKDKIIESYLNRESTQSIGERYFCSQQTISRFLKKNGVSVYGNFVGNKNFLPKLRDYLFDNMVLPTRCAIIDRGNFCSFHFGSKESNESLYNYMYYDGCFCLERKKTKFEFCPS